jgi:hypothetical protein
MFKFEFMINLTTPQSSASPCPKLFACADEIIESRRYLLLRHFVSRLAPIRISLSSKYARLRFSTRQLAPQWLQLTRCQLAFHPVLVLFSANATPIRFSPRQIMRQCRRS